MNLSPFEWWHRTTGFTTKVSDTLLPMIRASSAEFRTGDFARLAQALPEERQTLTSSMVANCLENLGKYGKDRMR